MRFSDPWCPVCKRAAVAVLEVQQVWVHVNRTDNCADVRAEFEYSGYTDAVPDSLEPTVNLADEGRVTVRCEAYHEWPTIMEDEEGVDDGDDVCQPGDDYTMDAIHRCAADSERRDEGSR